MDVAVALNILAVVAAFFALAISFTTSHRQNRLSHRANQLPVVVELFTYMRSYEFLSKEEQLWRDLPTIDQTIPFSQLPTSLRESANDVGTFYSMVAYLWMMEAADERLVIWVVHHRAVKTWRVLKPFVEAERALRGSEHSFFNVLEVFIAVIEKADVAAFVRRLWRRV